MMVQVENFTSRCSSSPSWRVSFGGNGSPGGYDNRQSSSLTITNLNKYDKQIYPDNNTNNNDNNIFQIY